MCEWRCVLPLPHDKQRTGADIGILCFRDLQVYL